MIFADSTRNFMNKFINDDWMAEMGYITEKECADANK